VSCERVAPSQDRRDVQAPGDSFPRTRDILRFGQRLDRSQQSFTGNARPIRALAADEVSLDNYRAQSPFNSPVGDVFAAVKPFNCSHALAIDFSLGSLTFS